jgi:hypothetical protein
MRWQLLTFAMLPILEAIWLIIRSDTWLSRVKTCLHLAAAGLMSVVVFSPHFVAKQIVYGHPLGGLHQTAQNWLNPSLWTVLGSTDRSLFYWTPITLPALAGMMYMAIRFRRPAVAILAAAIAVQIYTVSALLGGGVFLGWSFGFRILTETCVLMAPGVAVLLERANPRMSLFVAVGGSLLMCWNLLLLGGYRHCVEGANGGNPAIVFGMVIRYVMHRPLEAIGILLATAWLTYTLVAWFLQKSAESAAGNARHKRAWWVHSAHGVTELAAEPKTPGRHALGLGQHRRHEGLGRGHGARDPRAAGTQSSSCGGGV